jgi:hypothetical protein
MIKQYLTGKYASFNYLCPENDNPFRVTLNLVLENQGNLLLFFNSVTH